MTQEELLTMLQKAGISTATGGLMPEEAKNRFIDATVDSAEFLKMVTTERNIAVTRDIDSLGVANRLMYKATEQTEPGTIRTITPARRQLTPVEAILPYDISLSWLEENIAGNAGEDQVNAAFSKQFSRDLVDLSFNGDKDAGAGADQNFLIICDGFLKRVKADANAHAFVRGASTDWKGTVFPGLIKALPAKYKTDKSQLRLFVSFDVEEEYRKQLSDRATALGDAYLTEGKKSMYQGVIVEPVPAIPYGDIILTAPKNLAIGLGRDMNVYRFVNGRKRQLEYTITTRVDANYAVSDAVAYCD